MTANGEFPEGFTDPEEVKEALEELLTMGKGTYVTDPETGQKISAVEAKKRGILQNCDPLGYVYPAGTRITAIKTFLDFTAPKPKTTTELQVSPHDAWLSSLTEDEDDKEEGSSDEGISSAGEGATET